MAKFCPECGNPIIETNLPFCPKCGAKLQITSPTSQTPTNQPSAVQQPPQPSGYNPPVSTVPTETSVPNPQQPTVHRPVQPSNYIPPVNTVPPKSSVQSPQQQTQDRTTGSITKKSAPTVKTKIRDDYVAFFLSFLIPGWGQLYNGKTRDGLIFFGAFLIPCFFLNAYPGLFIIPLVIWLYGMYDAATTAEKINRGEIEFTGKSRLFWMPIVLIVLIIISISAFHVNQSAKNTLLSGNDVINSANAFTNQATAFNNVAQSHLSTFNSEMLTQNRNYPLLYSNIQSDLTTIDGFTPYLEDLNTKIISFSGQTTNLNGNVQQYADQSLVQMRAQYSDFLEYQSDMKTYELDSKTYLDSVSAGSPDATMLQAANAAKDKANAAIAQANIAAANINDLEQNIQQSQ